MKQKQQTQGLFASLKTIKDYRRKQGQRHSLELILIIMIMAITTGAKSERAICRFAKSNRKALIKALKIERKEIPGRCIIQRTIQSIDFPQLEKIFNRWTLKIPLKKKYKIAANGKPIKGVDEKAQNDLQSFINLVSIFASQRKQTLVAAKEKNKIPTVQEIIEMLDLKDIPIQHQNKINSK